MIVEMAKSNRTLKKINLGNNSKVAQKKAAEYIKLLKEMYDITITI